MSLGLVLVILLEFVELGLGLALELAGLHLDLVCLDFGLALEFTYL